MSETITVVSGLPRSGTSMLMRMFQAGGLEPLTDDLRKADEDNPRGYYEFERVKRLETDKEWVAQARGRVVKIVSPLLRHLPPEHSYKILFMHRALPEVMASQREMLRRRGEPADESGDEEMARAFARHLERLEAWLGTQANMEVLPVSHREVLEKPREVAERIRGFLRLDLDVGKMAAAVDRLLYRQRA